jgi:hypothetical protein
MRRDLHSKALLETDTIELQKYRKEKQKEREFKTIQSEMKELRLHINNICDKIKQIENRITNERRLDE